MLKLARPQLSAASLASVIEALESGQLVQGERVARFERAIAASLDVPHVVAVSSGTAALHLAVLALGIGPGDEVIVPAFTYPATANVVEVAGATTVPVDIRLGDCCLDPAQLEEAWTPRTKAIMPVHEFGAPADMDAVQSFAERHGIAVIEDAACALGAEFRGRKVGSFGRMGGFSFHPRKALTTGEGGAIATSDESLAQRLRALRNHGLDAAAVGRMDFVLAGLNYRMTEFQAALGLEQVADLPAELAARENQARRYDECLAALPEVRRPQITADQRAVYQTYHVILPEQVDRASVIAAMRAMGIETNLGAHALNCLTYFRQKYGWTDERCPNATRAYRTGLALPIGRHCGPGDPERVVAALYAALYAALRA